ncbi:hypothetical protein [Bremerella alba]|uniref:Uncharacterized protein n=1 Tax=Bremerella alba TaxID=980252 RepID=A0A7V8V9P8_9BACT|nr:hypothetical protein [Bremerella alba]MBA2117465.1 hypothetical protein [Bremerella alba]
MKEEIVDAHFAPPPTHLTWIEAVAWVVAAVLILVSGMVLHKEWYDEIDRQSLTMLAFYTMAQATGVVGIFYILRTSTREKSEPFQPGHWLLILLGVSAPFYVLSNITQVILFYDGFADTESYLRVNTVAIIFWQIVEWGLVLLLAFTLPVRGGWRVLLVVYFFGTVIFLAELVSLHFQLHVAAETWYGYLSTWYFVLSAVLLVGLAIWDVATTTQRRDWLHWVGSTNELVFFTPTFVFWIQSLMEVESVAGKL